MAKKTLNKSKSKPKPASKAKSASKRPASKPASKKTVAKTPSRKAVKKTVKAAKAVKPAKPAKAVSAEKPSKPAPAAKPKVNGVSGPFLKKQHNNLLQLRDSLLDSMSGVARDTLRSRAEGSEASAFGMHQADAGSDAYDRDFALSLLSQEQDALYEIEEAIKRVTSGTYGICELCGKAIPHARLEAIPFARYTVDCQSQLERQRKLSRTRTPVTSLFGLTDEEGGDGEEEETIKESND
jgi:RNA polymerase-binding transcription factor DksA